MDAFDRLMAGTDPAMVVVTVAVGTDRSGCLVGFSGQCSIDPPRYLVCLSNKNRTYRLARSGAPLAVHFLEDSRRGLAELFGEATGDEVDKLARCAWHAHPAGPPVLADCPGWLVGEQVAWHEVGDHAAVVLDAVDASAPGEPGELRPLRFRQVQDLQAGHEA